MKIKILTTSIQQLISGGTVYNLRLQAFLNAYAEVSLEQIEQVESYSFEKNHYYIIDGILISEKTNIKKIKDYSIYFLIHLWPSILEIDKTKKRKLKELETAICENFHLILTGENSKKHIEETLQSEFNGLIISPGIDKNWIQKTTFESLPKKMIYLSNFIEGKGHFRLLEVLSFLKAKEIIIDCYGEILSENYFNSFIFEKPDFVNYKGKIAHQDVNALLLDFDLFIHFSDYESFGMGILEAIATKLPTITTPVGIFKNKSSFKVVIDSFEPQKIAAYLDEVCVSSEEYRSLTDSISTYPTTTWEENFNPLINQFQLQ